MCSTSASDEQSLTHYSPDQVSLAMFTAPASEEQSLVLYSPAQASLAMFTASASEEQLLVLYSPAQASRVMANLQAEESGSSGTELAPATRPFIYNSGYGDFCFLRLPDTYPKPPTGVIDDFVRLGTFPFMRLPRELRDTIYELVLHPLLIKNRFTQGDARDLVLRIDHTWEDTECLFMREWVELILKDESVFNLDTETKRIYEEEHQQLVERGEKRFHPTRAKYQLTFPIKFRPQSANLAESRREKISPVSIACIRNLSNVNCEIREEFGKFLWTRSFLEINTHFVDGLACLKERPSIWKGIKTLMITVQEFNSHRRFNCMTGCGEQFGCESSSFRKGVCSSGFLELTAFMEQHLQLDLLVLWLGAKIPYTDRLQESVVKPKWVDALRGLRCAKEFHLIHTTSICDDEEIERRDEAWYTAEKERLEKLLTPLSIRGPNNQPQKGELGALFPDPEDYRGHVFGAHKYDERLRLNLDGYLKIPKKLMAPESSKPEFQFERDAISRHEENTVF